MSELPREMIEYLPAEAPFGDEQRAWLNGFIAGLFAARGRGEPDAPPAPAVTLTIVYGSQTGTAEALARSLAREAKQRGFGVSLAGMDEFTTVALAGASHLLVLCSTHGDGEPPDNARDFFDAVQAADAPALAHLAFSVLALGDANYERFCRCGRDLDVRLEALGAHRLYPRVDCDIDVDEPFVRWRDGVLGVLGGTARASAAVVDAAAAPARTLGPAGRVASLLCVRANHNLNGAGSGKETRHVVLGPGQPGPALSYAPGDALAILPLNAPQAVQEVIAAAGFDPQSTVSDHGEAMPLVTALTERFTIGRLNAPMVRAFARHTGAADLAALCAPERADALHAFLAGREFIDLLLDHPRAFATPEDLVGILPHLAPRLYSIASSPRAHPGEIHLTVTAVRYRAHGRERHGVCSGLLADRASPGTLLLGYVQENRRFRLPDDGDLPVIMIGPGTGIAPFRAFLHERRRSGARGPMWLFFGDRSAASDFLYAAELRELQREGVLTRLDTAFSRDQPEKIYVQHRMREQARELWNWIEAGAHIYVCGDAAAMARDVEAELLAVLRTVGRLGAEAAETRLAELRKEHRYQRDVY